jgi:hypothetical protein
MGLLSDKYSPWLLGSVTLAVTSMATFLLWGVASFNLVGLITYGVIYGAMAGGWSSTWTGFIKSVSGTMISYFIQTKKHRNPMQMIRQLLRHSLGS